MYLDNNNNNSHLLVPFLKLLVCFKHAGLSCCSHAGKTLLMGFWPTAARNICNKINKRFWKHLEYEKPMCFALMICLWKPTLKPQIFIRSGSRMLFFFNSVLVHLCLNLWPVLSLLSCCFCLFATHSGQGYVSIVFFIIHVPAPGQPPGAGKQIQQKTQSKTHRSSRKHRHKTVRSAGGPNAQS